MGEKSSKVAQVDKGPTRAVYVQDTNQLIRSSDLGDGCALWTFDFETFGYANA